ARGEIYRRSSGRNFVSRKQRASIQFEVGRNVSAGGENPFQAHRIHSCPVRGVCSLEDNKRRDRIDRKFEASVEKTGAVRSGQNPSIANSRVPDAGVLGPAGNRAPTARPHLEFMTALLRTILGDGERWRQ